MHEINFKVFHNLLLLKISEVGRSNFSRRKLPTNTVSSATLYTPGELFFGADRNNQMQKFLLKLPKGELKHEVQENIAKPY